MLEKNLKAKIKAYLKTIPGVYVFSYSAYLGETGIPDLIGVCRGKFIGIEVKLPTGILTDNQKVKIQILKDHGAYVTVARSVQDVKDFICKEVLNGTESRDSEKEGG